MSGMGPLKTVLRLLWSGGMDVWFALVFLITWIAPGTFGARTVHHLTFVMVLEFIIVHASGFMGALANRESIRSVRAGQFFGLITLYTVFALSFSSMYGNLWPLFAFWTLMLSRFPAVVLRPPDFNGQFVLMANWAGMVFLYVMGVFLTAVAPIPRLGVTPEVVALQEFGIGGLWPEEPHRALAFGTLYFTGLAVLAVINEAVFFAARRRRYLLKRTIP